MDYPELNVLINNAGIMTMDGVDGVVDDSKVASVVTTNLLGPIRMTSALIEHLKKQKTATVAYVTSGLAFTPLAGTATYNATKAGLHSFALSQRYLLKNTSVKVLEIIPPYVRTELNGPLQATDPNAMPLQQFIDETMQALGTDADEVMTERVKPMRNNAGSKEQAFVNQFNDMMAPRSAEWAEHAKN